MGSKKPITIKEDNDCECYTKGHTRKECPIIKNVTHPLRYYEFTTEEIRTLEECDRESFYRRCLPFSAILSAATYLGIKKGYLEKHQFGVFPKMGVAIALGYILGRVLYIPHCEEKLRNLSDGSFLGNTMREHEKNRNAPLAPPKNK